MSTYFHTVSFVQLFELGFVLLVFPKFEKDYLPLGYSPNPAEKKSPLNPYPSAGGLLLLNTSKSFDIFLPSLLGLPGTESKFPNAESTSTFPAFDPNPPNPSSFFAYPANDENGSPKSLVECYAG